MELKMRIYLNISTTMYLKAENYFDGFIWSEKREKKFPILVTPNLGLDFLD